jgi:Malectin domain
MDIYVEDTLVLDDLDVVARTGFYRRAFMYVVPQSIYITDNFVTITLNATKSQAMMSGIEIYAASVAPSPPSPPVAVPVATPVAPPITTTKAPTKSPVLTASPTKVPTKRPTKVPTKAPTQSPSKIPTKLPTQRPTVAPTKVPTKVPSKVPTKAPSKSPTKVPTFAPISKSPTKVPTKVPSKSPTQVPVSVPVVAPTPAAGVVLSRINCGSTVSVIMNNITWSADQYSSVGRTYNTCGNTTNSIYCTSRYFQTARGTPFRYNIPVPYNNATYQLRLHFAEQVRLCKK